jgi:hypothetical protein
VEAEAVRFVTTAGTKDLPKKLRRLFKNKLDKEQDAKLRQAADEYKAVGETDLATHRSTPTEHHSGGIPAAIEYRDGFSSLPNQDCQRPGTWQKRVHHDLCPLARGRGSPLT